MSEQRNKQLARIHILRAQLCLDEETYRDLLQTVGRVRSAAMLDNYGRLQVIAHLKSLLPSASKRRVPPQDKKIKALWNHLHKIGVVHHNTDWALRAYVRRQTCCERLEWLTSHQASVVIESLKLWVERSETR